METLLFSVKTVFPFFLMVIAGVLFQRFLHLKAEQTKVLNVACFYVLLPCSLFTSAAGYDLSGIESVAPYVYAIVAYIVITFLLTVISLHFIKDTRRAGAFIHSGFRPNAVLIGMPLALSLFGDNALPAVLMCIALTPLYNILGVVVLSYCAGAEHRLSLGQIIKSVCLNPLIIATVLGLLCSVFSLPVPELLLSPISTLGKAATPVAMLVIGCTCGAAAINSDRKLVFAAALVKTVAIPLVAVIPAILIGWRGVLLGAIYVVFAVPSAANSGVIAEVMGADGKLSNEIVFVSTCLSVVTICLGVTALKGLGLM